MNDEPTFALCGPTQTLVADGVRRSYRDVAAAQAALRSQEVSIVLGALPFDVRRPAALLTPDTVSVSDGPPDWPARQIRSR